MEVIYGDGSGYGYGYGYGDGNGYGDGSGDGSGYGYGNGYGDGSGDGYGSGEFTLAFAEAYISSTRITQLRDAGAVIGFWKSASDGRPSNGGSGPSRTVGMIEEIEGPLKICTPRALHATDSPWKWKGQRLWLVALYGEIQKERDKYGALKREILAEISPDAFSEEQPNAK